MATGLILDITAITVFMVVFRLLLRAKERKSSST
jgi:hypothetical protein